MSTYIDAKYIQKKKLIGHSSSSKNQSGVTDVTFVDNNTLISSFTYDGIIAWNVKTGVQLWEQEHLEYGVYNLTVPLHGPFIFAYNDGNYKIKIHNTETGEFERELERHNSDNIFEGKIINLVFAPDCQVLVSGMEDSRIIFWDVFRQQNTFTLHPPKTNTFLSTVFAGSPYREIKIVRGRTDGTVELIYPDTTETYYKIETMRYGSRIRYWTGLSYLSDYRVTALAFRRSVSLGQRLASGHGDGNIVIWDVDTQRKMNTLLGHTKIVANHKWSPEVIALAWSPDGTHLASVHNVSQNIRLWKPDSAENFDILRMDTSVDSIAFSPDGRTLASGGSGSIVIWERTD